jgi:hypothetical protein
MKASKNVANENGENNWIELLYYHSIENHW